jgi:hypothetical protein
MGLVGILRQRNMKSRVVMILHDAIWVETPIEEAEEAKKLLEQSMTEAFEYPFVPLEVDFHELDTQPRVPSQENFRRMTFFLLLPLILLKTSRFADPSTHS